MGGEVRCQIRAGTWEWGKTLDFLFVCEVFKHESDMMSLHLKKNLSDCWTQNKQGEKVHGGHSGDGSGGPGRGNLAGLGC